MFTTSTSGTSSSGWGGQQLRISGSTYSWVDPDYPVLARPGPDYVTACTDLAICPQVCFDVNGYYRDLGVHWRSPISVIRKAYQRLDGPNDARLTYVFKQLLNKGTRYDYDRAPLGSMFVDRYVLERLKRQALDELRAAGAVPSDDGTDLIEALRRKGLDVEADTPDEGLDEPVEPVDDDERTARDSAEVETPWVYAYYRLKTRCADLERLQQWQELLLQAFHEKGVRAQFAVGYHHLMARKWLLYPAGNRVIAFLHDQEEPSIEIAREAVSDRVVTQCFTPSTPNGR